MHDKETLPTQLNRRLVLFSLVALAAAGGLSGFGTSLRASENDAALAALDSRNISGADALEQSQRGEMTIIDVRSPQEWKQTGVPAGARPVTIHDPQGLKGFVQAMRRSVNGKLDTPVALICARGNRSTRALNALQAAGFTKVLNIKEGMLGSTSGSGWLAQDLPLDSCANC